MAIRSAPYYWLACDAKDCKAESPGGSSDFSAYRDPEQAIVDAEDTDWLVIRSGDDVTEAYCEAHRAQHSDSCGRCGSVVKAGTLDDDGMCPECHAASLRPQDAYAVKAVSN
jgi:hypothetical protein